MKVEAVEVLASRHHKMRGVGFGAKGLVFVNVERMYDPMSRANAEKKVAEWFVGVTAAAFRSQKAIPRRCRLRR